YCITETIAGITSVAAIASDSFLALNTAIFSRDCHTNKNTNRLTAQIHTVPPKTPVKLYHWISWWKLAKPFPKVIQGKAKSHHWCRITKHTKTDKRQIKL